MDYFREEKKNITIPEILIGLILLGPQVKLNLFSLGDI
jgi:hypothetical protein